MRVAEVSRVFYPIVLAAAVLNLIKVTAQRSHLRNRATQSSIPIKFNLM
jgi:hypothetical protein